MKKVLFVCSRNKLRSPTAEHIFSTYDGLEVRSAGLSDDAVEKIGPEDVEWADYIFVMENSHRRKLQNIFRRELKGQKVICLGIPDKYDYMDEELVGILKEKVPRFLK